MSGSRSRKGSFLSLKSICNASGKSSNKKALRTNNECVANETGDPSHHWNSRTHIVPLNDIHVGYSISIYSGDARDVDAERLAPFTSIRSDARN